MNRKARQPRTGAGRARRPQPGEGPPVERFEVTLNGLRALSQRIDRKELEPDDWAFLQALVCKQIDRAENRIRRILSKIHAEAESTAARDDARGPVLDAEYSVHDTESRGNSPPTDANPTTGSVESGAMAGGDGAAPKGGKKKGHGRNGAGAYRNAKRFFHGLAAGIIGSLCPRCERGKMKRYRVKIVIYIAGQPLFDAEIREHEQARCAECGLIIRADGPKHVHEGVGTDYIRYGWSACAMLIVMHYFAGAPFKRLESLHKGWGVPISDANQWVIVSSADDLLLPLYKALEKHATQKATAFRIDDTGSMVIAIQKEITSEIEALQRLGKSTKDVRTGINATASHWDTPDGPVVLFHTGRHHAGEIVDHLLQHRQRSSPKLVKCTDGASKNFDHRQADKLIESTCNAHAFLKFREIKDKYPIEYAEAAAIYKQVFDNDDKARALSPTDRMLYHQKHSRPLLDELKKKCQKMLETKVVEPNSLLWKPVTFIINQWDNLIRFCEVPGVPLDTNLVEQDLIIPVRYLAGSFNYKTADGATVGDHAMSIVTTARANGVEPVAYLEYCLRHHEDLAKRPEYYLPWVYRERMKEGDSPPYPTRQQPPESSRGDAGAAA